MLFENLNILQILQKTQTLQTPQTLQTFQTFFAFFPYLCTPSKTGNAFSADVAKLADAPDLGSGAARHVGSTPIIRTHLS